MANLNKTTVTYHIYWRERITPFGAGPGGWMSQDVDSIEAGQEIIAQAKRERGDEIEQVEIIQRTTKDEVIF